MVSKTLRAGVRSTEFFKQIVADVLDGDQSRNCKTYLESKGAAYIEGSHDGVSLTMSWADTNPANPLTIALDLTWQASLDSQLAGGTVEDGDFCLTGISDENGNEVAIYTLAGMPAISIERNPSAWMINTIGARMSLVLAQRGPVCSKYRTIECSERMVIQTLAATLGSVLINAFDNYAMHALTAHYAGGLTAVVLDRFTADFKVQIKRALETSRNRRPKVLAPAYRMTKLVKPAEEAPPLIEDNPLRGTW